MDGWIGVGLDGTLAHCESSPDDDQIGEPVPIMADRVRQWLLLGKDVRIFTARVACDPQNRQRDLIGSWTNQHFGQVLPVTNSTDPAMIELWHDRCVQVRPNTGEAMFGATGRFPLGRLDPDDEGTLRFGIAGDPSTGLVHVDFGKKISTMALEPSLARAFAEALSIKADLAQGKG